MIGAVDKWTLVETTGQVNQENVGWVTEEQVPQPEQKPNRHTTQDLILGMKDKNKFGGVGGGFVVATILQFFIWIFEGLSREAFHH